MGIFEDNIRDKMLSEELNREDCDEENENNLFCLLKRIPAMEVDNIKELTEKEFRPVSKQSKRRSVSSKFSKRDYYVCKCTMCSERMEKVLVRFYNTIIQNNHFSSRRLEVVDTMIEKGKGNKINKLGGM